MANELTVTGVIEYSDSEGTELTVGEEQVAKTVSTKRPFHLKQAVGTSEEALNLGDTGGSLGYCVLINRDETNFINVKTGTGGTVFMRLDPGIPNVFRFGSGVTAPFVQADTGACQLEIFLCLP